MKLASGLQNQTGTIKSAPMTADIQLDDLRRLLVDNCMLRVPPEEIQMETKLFGPDSLGLDSIDALQLTVGIERSYGVPIRDPAVAREAFQSVATLGQWLAAQLKKNRPAA